jgi:hypothetical protein
MYNDENTTTAAGDVVDQIDDEDRCPDCGCWCGRCGCAEAWERAAEYEGDDDAGYWFTAPAHCCECGATGIEAEYHCTCGAA